MSMLHHKAPGHPKPRHHMQTSQHPIPKLPELPSKEAVIYKTQRKKGTRAEPSAPDNGPTRWFLASAALCRSQPVLSAAYLGSPGSVYQIAYGMHGMRRLLFSCLLLCLIGIRHWGYNNASLKDAYVMKFVIHNRQTISQQVLNKRRTPILLLLARTCLCKQSTSGDPTASVRVNLHNDDPPPARRLSRLARHSAVHRRTLRKQCRPGMHGPPRRSCVPVSS
ncbi:hypothetical protein IWZ01DRAFT_308367 [Phyllosticta capitalensis]